MRGAGKALLCPISLSHRPTLGMGMGTPGSGRVATGEVHIQVGGAEGQTGMGSLAGRSWDKVEWPGDISDNMTTLIQGLLELSKSQLYKLVSREF